MVFDSIPHAGAVLRLLDDGVERFLPLATETMLGRSGQMTWTLEDPHVPTFLAEIRYFPDVGRWGFRGEAHGVLVPVGDREGLGRLPHPQFHSLTCKRGGTFDGRLTGFRLLQDGPPAAFAVDVHTGAVLCGDAFEDHVDVHEGLARPADWEELGDVHAVPSTGFLMSRGRMLRVHFPACTRRTLSADETRVPADDLMIHLEVEHGRVSGWLKWLDSGRTIDDLPQEALRILVPYALHQKLVGFGVPHGTADAYADWLLAGGNPSRTVDALKTERARLRRQLAARGVAGTQDLLPYASGVVHRRQKRSGCYLNVPPAQVHLSLDGIQSLEVAMGA